MKQLIITDRDNDAVYHLNVGQAFTILLKLSPGTGYSWHICEDNKDILRQLDETDFQSTDNQLLGGAEHQVFHFYVSSSGRQNLKLGYRRSWERASATLRFFSITIIAKD
jgi:predicted secreted protein